MRILLTIISLLIGMQGYAQFDRWDTDGTPTIPIVRRHCLHDEDGEMGARSIQRSSASQDLAPLKATGTPNIVVCLADFADVKFTVAEEAEAVKGVFELFFNGDGVGAGENPYSVSDYFKGMSNGVFTPNFVITDPVTVSKERAYYGDDNGSSRKTLYRNEALALLSAQLKDRVGELDSDGDGMIDGVIIVFPGCGANVGDGNGMHPACWPSAVTASGVSYATALVSPELLGMDESAQGGANNAKLNGIGVFVHEMSHMLGLPDFYDLNYKGPGMDYWSLMDYGEYWHNGYMPTPYTAYERHYMGWTTLVELTEPTYVSNMKALGDEGSAYVIYNDGNRNEYYILENRTVNDPWSKSLCTSLGSGMMIYHVDYDASAWSRNNVNTDVNRQRMTIVPANGHFEICDNLIDDMGKYISELRGHLWPLKNVESVLAYWGIAGNNQLTDSVRTEGDRVAPAARLNTPNTDGSYLMHKPITDIAFDDDTKTISFSFMGGTETSVEDVLGDVAHGGDAVVKVYSVDGRQVAVCRESALDTLPMGVYVLKNVQTGKTSKCFVGRR